MNDKTLELINSLADKFGITAEYLWSVLIKQAPISAAINITTSIVLVTVWFVAYRIVKRKTTPPEATQEDRYPVAEWCGEDAILAWPIIALAALFVFIMSVVALYDSIHALTNPEYWALTQILNK